MIVAISIFLILAFTSLLIRSRSSKSERMSETLTKSFWEKEREANSVRRKDISNLPYITIPLDSLPFHESSNPSIIRCQDKIRNLATLQILNLSGMTNTDLKLKYGAANLPFLINCDTYYTELVKNLYQWGKALYDENLINDSQTVLEFAVNCQTDVMSTYTLLGDIYSSQLNRDGIHNLIQTIQDIHSPNKVSALNHLESLLA